VEVGRATIAVLVVFEAGGVATDTFVGLGLELDPAGTSALLVCGVTEVPVTFGLGCVATGVLVGVECATLDVFWALTFPVGGRGGGFFGLALGLF